MKITIVMGLAGSGKSTYIKNNFKDRTVIDLYDYQKDKKLTAEKCWETYVQCKNDLIKAIENNEDVVLEHTLYLAKRRKYYIDEIRKITDCPIEIIYINPPIDVLRKRLIQRELYLDDDVILENINFIETPVLEEGYKIVRIVRE